MSDNLAIKKFDIKDILNYGCTRFSYWIIANQFLYKNI